MSRPRGEEFCKLMPSPDELLSWSREQRAFHTRVATLPREQQLFELAKAYTSRVLQSAGQLRTASDKSSTHRSSSSRSVSPDFLADALREDALGKAMLAREHASFSVRIHARRLFEMIQADVNVRGRKTVQLNPSGEPVELVQLLAVVELGLREDQGGLSLRLVYWSDKDDVPSEFYRRAQDRFEKAIYRASCQPSRDTVAEAALRMHGGVGVLLSLKLLDAVLDPGRLGEIYSEHKLKILSYYALSQRG
jgi:hypothetical protein